MHTNSDKNAGGREVNSPHEIEQLLRFFAPVGPAIDRDRLMFQAGMQAARMEAHLDQHEVRIRRAHIWPIVSFISTAAALAMVVMLWQRPERVVTGERAMQTAEALPVQSDQPQRQAATDSVSVEVPAIDRDTNYLVRRERMIREGLDALADASGGGSAAPTATRRDLLEEMVGLPPAKHSGQVRDLWWQQWLISGDRL